LAAPKQVDVPTCTAGQLSDFGQIFGLMLVLSGLEIFRALERLK